MFPEISQTECAIATGKGALKALEVVQIGVHDFGAELREDPGFLGAWITGERANGQSTARLLHNGANQAAALSARCANHGNQSALVHGASLHVDKRIYYIARRNGEG